jgi:hypothetical protein
MLFAKVAYGLLVLSAMILIAINFPLVVVLNFIFLMSWIAGFLGLVWLVSETWDTLGGDRELERLARSVARMEESFLDHRDRHRTELNLQRQVVEANMNALERRLRREFTS